MSSIKITNARIISIAQDGTTAPYYHSGTVRIENDRIVAVGSDSGAPADQEIDGTGYLVMPGLINGHNHFEQTFMAGIVRMYEGTTADWIQNFKIPMTLMMDSEDYYLSSMLAATQMIRSGVTCSVNHICQQSADSLQEFGISESFRAVGESGIRCLAPVGLAGKNEPDEFIVTADRFETLLGRWHQAGNGAFGDRLRVWAGPTGFYSSTDPMWDVARRFADASGGGIHTHLATFARGDVEQAERLRVLGPDFVGAHAVWLDDRDVSRLARWDARVVHNPTYKLGFSLDSEVHAFGDGIAPVGELAHAGCLVGLGQDGCMGDTQDIFKEMRMLAYTQHYRHRDRQLFPPTRLLEMATIDNAKVMKWDKEIGSLEPGKKADLILLDLSDPKFVPLLNVPANIVYQASGSDVDTVIIDGQIVMRHRQITLFDEAAILSRAQSAAASLVDRAGLGSLRTRAFQPWRGDQRLG